MAKLKILFVCTGNINRSPAAEIIMKQMTNRYEVDSAGTTPKNNGKKTTTEMMGTLTRYGFEPEPIVAKQITEDLFNWADIILYMQQSHARKIRKLFYNRNMNKISPLYKYSKETLSNRKIEDPQFTKNHEKTFKQIFECVTNFLKENHVTDHSI
jgi:protein-tyrosine phosphatase